MAEILSTNIKSRNAKGKKKDEMRDHCVFFPVCFAIKHRLLGDMSSSFIQELPQAAKMSGATSWGLTTSLPPKDPWEKKKPILLGAEITSAIQ